MYIRFSNIYINIYKSLTHPLKPKVPLIQGYLFELVDITKNLEFDGSIFRTVIMG